MASRIKLLFVVVVLVLIGGGIAAYKNVTLGLPKPRTSPDHGTAFDIAGQGVADAASLVEAVRMARALSLEPQG